ncbi:hypothetical protein LSTR_LSTR010391 [Laodelphax striatellus]|uniref:Poly(A)-specific ribonuclease RNA-binding domain-containing protein n=1 Tax=Laodelphax striatellus TaxID=195883 RepID=A0A482XHW9_LAOST|nr:hypothetical protein LSTR_LSTR010391 [Laodelphax striatellus]
MEVTRENFKTLLPTIKADIDEAEFFAIDGEFTGLTINGIAITPFDTPAEYYKKLKDGAMDFLFFQFGLAAFKFDEAAKKYNHKAYNFYLFPRPDLRTKKVADSRFLCQTSCIDFLAEYLLDFNKVFKQGISYLNSPDEKKALDLLEERKENMLNSEKETEDEITVPSDLELCVENACSQVEDFIKSEAEEKEIILLKNNSFLKKLVYQQVSKRFSEDGIELITINKALIARKNYSKEQKEKDILEKFEAEKKEIQDVVGFTLVIRQLAQSGKLIIGHNFLIDLCHILNQFFSPLPEEYNEFKSMLHDIFPRLLDTKYMCHSEPFTNLLPTSTLAQLLPVICKSPFKLPEVGCIDKDYGYSTSSNKNHEAGFDAYITGLLFITFAHYLGTKFTKESDDVPLTKMNVLNRFINRLHLMKVNDTYIDICGNDPDVSRDHVFYVTFPSIWRFKQIADLFRPVGNIVVSWIDETSAWVALSKPDMAPDMVYVDTSEYDDVTILSYEQRRRTMRRYQSTSSSATPQLLFSPDTSSALKKRKREVQSTAACSNIAATAAGRRRSRSSGRESFSRRSFETIPEEAEEVDSPIRKKRLIDDCEKTSKCDKKMEFDENDAWD